MSKLFKEGLKKPRGGFKNGCRAKMPLFTAFLLGLLSVGVASTAMAEGSAELFQYTANNGDSRCYLNTRPPGTPTDVFLYVKKGETITLNSGTGNFVFERVEGEGSESFTLSSSLRSHTSAGDAKYKISSTGFRDGEWDIEVRQGGVIQKGRLAFSTLSFLPVTGGTSCRFNTNLYSKTRYLGKNRVFMYLIRGLVTHPNKTTDMKVYLDGIGDYQEETFLNRPDPNYFDDIHLGLQNKVPLSYESLQEEINDESVAPFDSNSTAEPNGVQVDSCNEYKGTLSALSLVDDLAGEFAPSSGADKEIVCFKWGPKTAKIGGRIMNLPGPEGYHKQLPFGQVVEKGRKYKFKSDLGPGKYKCVAAPKKGRRVNLNMIHVQGMFPGAMVYYETTEEGVNKHKALKMWWGDEKYLTNCENHEPEDSKPFTCTSSCNDICSEDCVSDALCTVDECDGACYLPEVKQEDKIKAAEAVPANENFFIPCLADDKDYNNSANFFRKGQEQIGMCNAKGWNVRQELSSRLAGSLWVDLLDSVEIADLPGYEFTVKDADKELCNDPIVLDADDDKDGISNREECGATKESPKASDCIDSDGDGKKDYDDPDSDNDGIPDFIEAYDRDGDGEVTEKDFNPERGSVGTKLTPEQALAEEKRRGSPGPQSSDDDGIPDYRDIDSDNDGIPDVQEAFVDANGGVSAKAICNGNVCTFADTDKDGVPDYKDLDSDNDGIPDSIEAYDKNKDGKLTVSDIKDGVTTGGAGDVGIDPNADSNDLGINTTIGSAILGSEADEKKIINPITLEDTDKDTRPNFRDLDSDGDGIDDFHEAFDKNADGQVTKSDIKSDVTPNSGEDTPINPATVVKSGDKRGINADLQGAWDKKGTPFTAADQDGDRIPNQLDLDSDNDGIPDRVEAYATPEVNPAAPQSADLKTDQSKDGNKNGIDDQFDRDCFGTDAELKKGCPSTSGSLPKLSNTNDGSGKGENKTPNYLDPDSDGDGALDNAEVFGTDAPAVDVSGHDTNKNGLDDRYEVNACSNQPCVGQLSADKLNPGNYPKENSKYNYLNPAVGEKKAIVPEADTDGDGIPDGVECGVEGAKTYDQCLDSDKDGKKDYEDWDSDNDGIPDADECDFDKAAKKCRVDQTKLNYRKPKTNAGKKDGDADYDGDGIPNSIECGITSFDSKGGAMKGEHCRNTDKDVAVTDGRGDDLPDFRDGDSDGDGIPDEVECPSFEGMDLQPTSGPLVGGCVNSDYELGEGKSDNLPDYLDPDSDGDGVKDFAEGVVDKNGKPITPVAEGDKQDANGNGIEDHVDVACLSTNCGALTPDQVKVVEDPANSGKPKLLEGVDKEAYVDPKAQPGVCSNKQQGPLDSFCTGLIIPNNDHDGDGIADSVECGDAKTYGECENNAKATGAPLNPDGDDYPSYRDLDSDDDGIPDAVECTGNISGLVTDVYQCENTDKKTGNNSDEKPDYLDDDSDGDGVDDKKEGVVNSDDHVVPPPIADARKADTNQNGIFDVYEPGVPGAEAAGTPGNPKLLNGTKPGDDTEPAKKKAYTDASAKCSPGSDADAHGGDACMGKIVLGNDHDGDGIPDDVECAGYGTYELCDANTDTDGNGTGAYRDKDSDEDGIPDAVECGDYAANGNKCRNSDEHVSMDKGILDALPDFLDKDSDGDGIPDEVECPQFEGSNKLASSGAIVGGCVNSDHGLAGEDNDPDYLDTDSDGDSTPDIKEGLTSDGVTPVAVPSTPADKNKNGIDDAFDTECKGVDPSDAKSCAVPTIEKDSSGKPAPKTSHKTPGAKQDYRNPDVFGCPVPADPTNKACTGLIPKGGEYDYDGDGIPDSVECAGYATYGACETAYKEKGFDLPYRSLDSDKDGISDDVECAYSTTTGKCRNTDKDEIPSGQGISDDFPDFLDRDSDGDGIPDKIECPAFDKTKASEASGEVIGGCVNSDGNADNKPDYLDTDSDEDNTPDIKEGLTEGNGVTVITPSGKDANGNGIDDAFDTECDSHNGCNLPDVKVENGKPVLKKTDPADGAKPDFQNDAYPTKPPVFDMDGDEDGDGIPNRVECADAAKPNPTTEADCKLVDTDGDGVADYLDGDSDNDGESDGKECPNWEKTPCLKTDGVPNYRKSADSDNDGIPNSVECVDLTKPNLAPKADGTVACGDVDTDNDKVPDYLDKDSDNDGIEDAVECPNYETAGKCRNSDEDVSLTDPSKEKGTPDSIPDFRDKDSDGDGIPDAVETGRTDAPGTPDGNGIVYPMLTTPLPNTDGLGEDDYLDSDSDGDGIPDIDEAYTDADGVAITPSGYDYNKNGLDDAFDPECKGAAPGNKCLDNRGTPYVSLVPVDNGLPVPANTDKKLAGTDPSVVGDDLPDYLDQDSDGDGIPDQVECRKDSASGECVNTDKDVDSMGDKYPDFRDTDSDADGVKDYEEGLVDTNGAPVKSPAADRRDANGNGIEDHVDLACKPADGTNPCGDGTSANVLVVDKDDNGQPDLLPGKDPVDGTPAKKKDAYIDANAKCTPASGAAENSSKECKGTIVPGNDHDGDGIPDKVECAGHDTYEACDNGATGPYRDPSKPGTPDSTDNCPNHAADLSTPCTGTVKENGNDHDGDGIPDKVECGVQTEYANCPDSDDDGKPDYMDKDSDNDGIEDRVECEYAQNSSCPTENVNGVAVPTYKYSADDDGDGIPNSVECVDANHPVNSADGKVECANVDTDGDKVPDYKDEDSDGDGIPDKVECPQFNAAMKKQDMGANVHGCVNSDNGLIGGDNTPDYRDTDSDADGVLDSQEGVVNADGEPVQSPADKVERKDANNNGVEDHVDLACKDVSAPCGAVTPSNVLVVDNDGDGQPDLLSGSGSKKAYVDSTVPVAPVVPPAGDNCPHHATDLRVACTGPVKGNGNDHDGDGIPDEVECAGHDTYEECEASGSNTDNDKSPNYRDKDDDGDGIPTKLECKYDKSNSDFVNGCVDSDKDDKPDYLDDDSDNDGILDIEEGVKHEDGTSINPSNKDENHNGIDDAFDTECNTANGCEKPNIATDADNLPVLDDSGTSGKSFRVPASFGIVAGGCSSVPAGGVPTSIPLLGFLFGLVSFFRRRKK